MLRERGSADSLCSLSIAGAMHGAKLQARPLTRQAWLTAADRSIRTALVSKNCAMPCASAERKDQAVLMLKMRCRTSI